jgi:hypothetical protein
MRKSFRNLTGMALPRGDDGRLKKPLKNLRKSARLLRHCYHVALPLANEAARRWAPRVSENGGRAKSMVLGSQCWPTPNSFLGLLVIANRNHLQDLAALRTRLSFRFLVLSIRRLSPCANALCCALCVAVAWPEPARCFLTLFRNDLRLNS